MAEGTVGGAGPSRWKRKLPSRGGQPEAMHGAPARGPGAADSGGLRRYLNQFTTQAHPATCEAEQKL